MWRTLWTCLASLLVGYQAFASTSSKNPLSTPINITSMNVENDFFPDDLSFIKKLAAVGDSYSAGIGAGSRLGGVTDWLCSRYDHAFPNLINEDPRLGDPSEREFQFHSCSGAVIKDVINDQLPLVNSDQQFLLISAGGNDAELTNILNQCIYQWAAFSVKQVAVGKIAELLEEEWAKWVDLDALSRGCQSQLETSRGIIEGLDFSERLDTLLEAAKKKLAPDGMIYYTGYAKFFGTDLGSECDKVSWSTWFSNLHDAHYEKEFLNSFNRREMNHLVDLVNEKLEAAVEKAGDQVQFVNYDPYVGRYNGRYCELGVDESSEKSNSRHDLMFFELNTADVFGSNPWKRGEEGAPNGTFHGNQNLLAKITLFLDPDAVLTHEDRIEGDMGVSALNGDLGLQMSALDGAVVSQVSASSILDAVLPDGYGRVFHPQILLHEIIAHLVLFHVTNRRLEQNGYDEDPAVTEPPDTCSYNPPDNVALILRYKNTAVGKAVKKGTKLRILPVGDSITVGFLSERNGGDGNGYRGQLKKNLSKDNIMFAGTESSGSMSDGYYAAWSGQTIQFISNHMRLSLEQRPNVILLAAGTNDMNENPAISKEGNDPAGAADRLGKLIDKMIKECPDATILVAMIINTCDPKHSLRTKEYQQLIPRVVRKRKDDGKHVLAVDFTTIETGNLQDCVHPTNEGYKLMGHYWYDFIHQIPDKWIKKPVGPDPDNGDEDGSKDNGGIDKDIPAPNWGKSPIQVTSKEVVEETAKRALGNGPAACKAKPGWKGTGKIALGNIGHNGDWKYKKNWKEEGKVAAGLGLDTRHVRLVDMNGDGKADYVWIHPETGEITCWINNLPDPWSFAGNNKGVIGSGVGPSKTIFLADMNGDGMADYLVVDPDNGSVRVWWNYGSDSESPNGWKFVEGGEIASGVPHANLETIRFPDINGDGRADYVYIGEGGSLMHYMNIGSPGGREVLFEAQGGIAEGAVRDISKLVFADMNGDGRDDYLIWDNDGGLTGFLNQRTNREGVPVFIDQGPAKTIADGIHENPDSIRLADMDGDGKDDYVHIGENGALFLWYNRGETKDSMAIDGLRFADIDGDGVDDYVWLDPDTGAPTVYLNAGPDKKDSLGWTWSAVNGGKPIAAGTAPSSQVVFGDLDGDGLDDYLEIDPKTGSVEAFLNLGEDKDSEYGWRFKSIGQIISYPGNIVRFADIDGDGRVDYINLLDNGGTVIYQNIHASEKGVGWMRLNDADASGIGQRPEEIEFYDINGDGKADYIWTRPLDGRVEVWLNDYPKKPTWRSIGVVAEGVGTSGSNIRYAQLQKTNRTDYVAVDPKTGALAAWLNGCSD